MSIAFECLLCEAHGADPFLLDCQDYYLGSGYRADYYKCANCGLIQQSPVPTDVRGFYKGYPIHRRKTSLFELARRRIMRACYFDIDSIDNPGSMSGAPLVLMDFGCGDGWFLDSIGNERVERMGFELDVDQARRVADEIRVPVYSDADKLLADYGGRVDVVTMHFVLEHISHLRKAIRLVHGSLAMGGLLFITVPEISSWEFRLFGRKWHNLDPPRHISFPQKHSIDEICRKWGFEMVGSYAIPFPNGVAGSISAVLSGRFRFTTYLLALPFGILLSRMFPTGNRAYLLKKVSEQPGSKVATP